MNRNQTELALLHGTRVYLCTYDELGLLRYLNDRWQTTELERFLQSANSDVVKISCLALGLRPEQSNPEPLLDLLSHDDNLIVSLAEFAIWNIWYAQEGPEAERALRQAAHLQPQESIARLDALMARFPNWAEAYNQRAIAHYRAQAYKAALKDCQRTLDMVPRHFGALASRGHALARLGRYSQALTAYREALAIHPRMAGIRQSIVLLRRIMRQLTQAS